MSVTLGALVIAISTEFSVLLSERHRQERLAGHSYGAGVASCLPLHGGCSCRLGCHRDSGIGVLVCSDIAMLRDFGLVTLGRLSVSLLGVLIALPAAVVLAESEQPLSEWIRDGLGGLKRIVPRRRARRRGLTAP